MTKLSPATQTVLDAIGIHGLFPEEIAMRRSMIAIAFRAAADAADADWLGVTVIHHLYAIADELENKNAL